MKWLCVRDATVTARAIHGYRYANSYGTPILPLWLSYCTSLHIHDSLGIYFLTITRSIMTYIIHPICDDLRATFNTFSSLMVNIDSGMEPDSGQGSTATVLVRKNGGHILNASFIESHGFCMSTYCKIFPRQTALISVNFRTKSYLMPHLP